MVGYGAWWCVCESLAESDNNHLAKTDLDTLAFDLHMDAPDLVAMVETMISVGLLQEDDDGYYSQSLIDRLAELREKVEARRKQASKAGKASAAKRQTQQQTTGVTKDADDEHETNASSTSVQLELNGGQIRVEQKSTDGDGDGERDKKNIHRYTDTDLDFAKAMWSVVEEIAPDYAKGAKKNSNLMKWAEDFRLMRERDNRTEGDIREVVEGFQHVDFWRDNLRSPKGLRGTLNDGRDKFSAILEAVRRAKKGRSAKEGWAPELKEISSKTPNFLDG